MDVIVIVVIVVVIFVILAVAGGVGFWIYLASRPKKMTWQALVYQVGEGSVQFSKKIHEKANIKYKLSDLKPYTDDIIEKIDKKSGATHYWLQSLKKPTPAVTADCVEVWSQKKKIVRVLLEEDTCTLLKSGYDRKLGSLIFRPLPHDRINMIKTELSERESRIENTKDILSAITPFVTIAVSLLALVVVAYFQSQAAVRIAEINDQTGTQIAATQEAVARMFIEGGFIETPEGMREITEEAPPEIPP